jgi:DNA-binding transcriptional MerR regulator
MAKQWTLRELAAETGVPERTIRFYISRELLPPPLKGGRGAAYGPLHKTLLETIKKLQAKGMMLAEISRSLALADVSPTQELISHGLREAREENVPGRENELGESAEIAFIERPATLPEPETWRSYSIAGDVVVMLRAGTSPWRTKAILSALRRFAAQIEDETKKEDKGE